MIIDGCHNGDSVNLFLNEVRRKFPNRKILTVLGVGLEKCLGDILREVSVLSDEIILTQSNHFKALSETELNTHFLNKKKIVPLNYLDKQNNGTVAIRLSEAIQLLQRYTLFLSFSYDPICAIEEMLIMMSGADAIHD